MLLSLSLVHSATLFQIHITRFVSPLFPTILFYFSWYHVFFLQLFPHPLPFFPLVTISPFPPPLFLYPHISLLQIFKLIRLLHFITTQPHLLILTTNATFANINFQPHSIIWFLKLIHNCCRCPLVSTTNIVSAPYNTCLISHSLHSYLSSSLLSLLRLIHLFNPSIKENIKEPREHYTPLSQPPPYLKIFPTLLWNPTHDLLLSYELLILLFK